MADELLRVKLAELLSEQFPDFGQANPRIQATVNGIIALFAHPVPEQDGWRFDMENAPRDRVLLLYGNLYGMSEQGHPNGLIRVCGYWDTIDEAWALTDTTWAGPFIKPVAWREAPESPPLPEQEAV